VRRITRITRTCVYLKSLQLLRVRVMAFLHHPHQPASPAHPHKGEDFQCLRTCPRECFRIQKSQRDRRATSSGLGGCLCCFAGGELRNKSRAAQQ
jgi:hypothetical protein